MSVDNTLSMVAYENINPMRFVIQKPGVINGALQATGSDIPIVGISVESVNNMPGTSWQTQFVPQMWPAAASGQGLRVYGENGPETYITVGSGQTVNPGDLLTSDASGNAVPINPATVAAGLYWIGARAIEGGDAANPIRCQPKFFPLTKPA